MPSAAEERLAPYLGHLAELPFVVEAELAAEDPRPEQGRAADVVVRLRLADGTARLLAIELKTSHVGADTAHSLLDRLSGAGGDRLVAAPYIGAKLGDSLQAAGINFIDRRGNCYLHLDDRYVARLQGRTAPAVPARGKQLRAAGYQVMFALLSDPNRVSLSQRGLARAAGTSKQPVADLLARLEAEKRLVRRGRAFTWVDPPDKTLLERWVAGYSNALRPRLLVGRYSVPAKEPAGVERWVCERIAGVRLGGTAGAYRLVGHYRGPLTVAHIGPGSEGLRRNLKALPSPDGDLLWMRRIGTASEVGESADTVHPLLIFAELVTDADPRAVEAAAVIRERYLPWSL